MADVPLIETTKPNGFTQFSLSFKCVQPDQALGLREEHADADRGRSSLDAPVQRLGHPRALLQGDLTCTPTRATPRPPIVRRTAARSRTRLEPGREYADVRSYSPDALIPDEELTEGDYRPECLRGDRGGRDHRAAQRGQLLRLPGLRVRARSPASTNGQAGDACRTSPPARRWRSRRTSPRAQQLVIDTGLRRVAVVTPHRRHRRSGSGTTAPT